MIAPESILSLERLEFLVTTTEDRVHRKSNYISLMITIDGIDYLYRIGSLL
jgi:hypothetical protein